MQSLNTLIGRDTPPRRTSKMNSARQGARLLSCLRSSLVRDLRFIFHRVSQVNTTASMPTNTRSLRQPTRSSPRIWLCCSSPWPKARLETNSPSDSSNNTMIIPACLSASIIRAGLPLVSRDYGRHRIAHRFRRASCGIHCRLIVAFPADVLSNRICIPGASFVPGRRASRDPYRRRRVLTTRCIVLPQKQVGRHRSGAGPIIRKRICAPQNRFGHSHHSSRLFFTNATSARFNAPRRCTLCDARAFTMPDQPFRPKGACRPK